jgi:hypothetical protein
MEPGSSEAREVTLGRLKLMVVQESSWGHIATMDPADPAAAEALSG